MKGKNFANRHPEEQRPENDLYETPTCLTRMLLEKTDVLSQSKHILEPCCGYNSIANVLRSHGYTDVTCRDILFGNDFLREKYVYGDFDTIVTNPPFSMFDKIVEKAKAVSPLVCVIGKVTFFGSHSRNRDGFWKHLRDVYIFDRQIAYDRPLRSDGKVFTGMLVTGWFVWDAMYDGDARLHTLDVDEYVVRKRDFNDGNKIYG